jgi:hypothetical protein
MRGKPSPPAGFEPQLTFWGISLMSRIKYYPTITKLGLNKHRIIVVSILVGIEPTYEPHIFMDIIYPTTG